MPADVAQCQLGREPTSSAHHPRHNVHAYVLHSFWLTFPITPLKHNACTVGHGSTSQTGKRVWKVCGFPGTVHHILPVKLFRRASMSRLRRDVVATDAILTWSDDNVVRLWNMLVRNQS